MSQEIILSLIIQLWGEEEEQSAAYARIIAEHVLPDLQTDVVIKDMYFNRYLSPTSYEELARTILEDDWEEDEPDDYLEKLGNALDNGTVEEFLFNDGWRVDFVSGGAIGFDSEVLKDFITKESEENETCK